MSQRKPKFAYFQGEIVPFEQATVSVMTQALNYGTGVFGGLRGYWNDEAEELYVVRPLDHFRRVLNSAKLLRMTIDKTPEELTAILKTLLLTEGYRENTYIRPLAYKSAETIALRLNGIEDSLTIFAVPFGNFAKREGGFACVLFIVAACER